MKKTEIEEGVTLSPKFDANGLIPCIVTSAKNNDVLMMAYMNESSLRLSIQTGEAHYWSRSRQSLWKKGESSGNTQKITSMKIDCDQDCLWITVEMPVKEDHKETCCHTGRCSCFYREITIESDTSELKFCD